MWSCSLLLWGQRLLSTKKPLATAVDNRSTAEEENATSSKDLLAYLALNVSLCAHCLQASASSSPSGSLSSVDQSIMQPTVM
jgi:hypothetical protein